MEQPQGPGTSDFREFVLEMQKTITDLRKQVGGSLTPPPRPRPPTLQSSLRVSLRGCEESDIGAAFRPQPWSLSEATFLSLLSAWLWPGPTEPLLGFQDWGSSA